MTFRCALLALLVLALYSAGCAPKAVKGGDALAPVPSPRPITVTPAVPMPTRSPTSTAAPTLPPAAREFSESFDTKPPNWVFVQADGGQRFAAPATREGFLVFDLPAPNQWGYALYIAGNYGDVLVETQVQSRTSGDGSPGLVCDYDERKGWYEFNIFQDQTYQLLFGQWLSKDVVRYTPLYQGKSQDVRMDENTIGLLCQGNVLTPSINGLPLRQWPEQKFGLQAGQVGVSASSFADAPFSIAFDWVKISEP
jgi:hypothetical protein